MKTINKKCNKLVLISWSNRGSKWEHCGDKITGKEEIALCDKCEKKKGTKENGKTKM